MADFMSATADSVQRSIRTTIPARISNAIVLLAVRRGRIQVTRHLTTQWGQGSAIMPMHPPENRL